MTSPMACGAFWAVVVCMLINVSELRFASAADKTCQFESFRLADRIKPSHYELLLKLHDVNGAVVEGQVKIDVSVGTVSKSCPPPWDLMGMMVRTVQRKEPVGCNKKEIVLNANSRITFNKVRFITKSQEILESYEICRDPKSEMASIRFHKELEDNSHGQLVIDFSVNTEYSDQTGLFQSKWWDEASQEYILSYATQFEPASARKAFPCFDEPNMKATFGIIIEHHREYTALANAKAIQDEPVDGSPELIRTHFDVTPLMSTYLLALAVGRYEYLETKIMDEKIDLRVYVPEKEKEKGQYLLDSGRRSYAVLDDYFGIEQPIKKIDFIPIQNGFGAAMENWGLVTFQNELMLVDATTSVIELARRSIFVGHELAHFWFGNLVTMKWWDNLWLKESFAQWMGYLVANEVRPELNLNVHFVQQVLMKGLEADAKAQRTHPIKNPNLKTIQDIGDSFDQITYDKGASVMRMIESYVGHESFKLGLRDYINKFKYQNTEESDLWNALEARSDVPVARMMDTWLNQAGFPVVSVELIGGQKLRVKQERFEKDVTAEGKQQLWMIPVNMVVVHDGQIEEVKFVLSDRQQDIQLPDWFDATKGHWFKLNADARGFYRVQYDAKSLNLLENPIKTKQMDAIDRMILLDDMKALHAIKRIGDQEARNFVDLFIGEDSPSVMYSLAYLIDSLRWLTKSQVDKHAMLVDYFNKMVVVPVDGLQELQAKEAVMNTLIAAKYQPAIDFRAAERSG